MLGQDESVLHKPVFFTGMGRSGSTIVYEAFSAHESLGWLSNYSKLVPGMPVLSLVNRIFDNSYWFIRGSKNQGQMVHRFNNLIPRPQEAYPFWESCIGERFLWSFLRNERATREEIEQVRKLMAKTVKYQGKRRLTGKVTGPPRISFLSSIFPDAQFINVIRDGRCVVNSLLKVAFWREKGGLEKPLWRDALDAETVERWEKTGKDPVALAALLWCRSLEVAREEKQALSAGQYLEVKYESFVGNPHPVLSSMFEFSSLPDSLRAHRFVDEWGAIKDMNDKYKTMPRADIDTMLEIMGADLIELGYVNA